MTTAIYHAHSTVVGWVVQTPKGNRQSFETLQRLFSYVAWHASLSGQRPSIVWDEASHD